MAIHSKDKHVFFSTAHLISALKEVNHPMVSQDSHLYPKFHPRSKSTMLSHGLGCRSKHFCIPLKVTVKRFSRTNAFPWEAAIATLICRDIPVIIFTSLPLIPPSIILIGPSGLLSLSFFSRLSSSLLSLFVLLQLCLCSFLSFLLFSLGC